MRMLKIFLQYDGMNKSERDPQTLIPSSIFVIRLQIPENMWLAMRATEKGPYLKCISKRMYFVT